MLLWQWPCRWQAPCGLLFQVNIGKWHISTAKVSSSLINLYWLWLNFASLISPTHWKYFSRPWQLLSWFPLIRNFRPFKRWSIFSVRSLFPRQKSPRIYTKSSLLTVLFHRLISHSSCFSTAAFLSVWSSSNVIPAASLRSGWK